MYIIVRIAKIRKKTELVIFFHKHMKKQSRIKLSFNPNRSLGFMAD